jgi:hypothetical protein
VKSLLTAMVSSNRASDAPRQKCVPPPKDRCLLVVLASSNEAASSPYWHVSRPAAL